MKGGPVEVEGLLVGVRAEPRHNESEPQHRRQHPHVTGELQPLSSSDKPFYIALYRPHRPAQSLHFQSLTDNHALL